jgi:hypothetical protein
LSLQAECILTELVGLTELQAMMQELLQAD